MTFHHNPVTQEPYIRLPSPHDSIIITPFREPNEADESVMVSSMNDPLVGTWLISPPYPYTPDDARNWINLNLPPCEQILEQAKTQQYVAGCPFRCIREILEEDEQGIKRDVLIGGVDVVEHPFVEFAEGSAEREDGVRRNGQFEVGSEEKVWGIGGMLLLSYCLSFDLSSGLFVYLWCCGVALGNMLILLDWLDPAYHGRGIMTAIVRTVIHG